MDLVCVDWDKRWLTEFASFLCFVYANLGECILCTMYGGGARVGVFFLE